VSYKIDFTITALCPACGKELPAHSYLTESKAGTGPFDRDNPYERKDRRVFIKPCADCFVWRGDQSNPGTGAVGAREPNKTESVSAPAISGDAAQVENKNDD
jgi:hypothetical protein